MPGTIINVQKDKVTELCELIEKLPQEKQEYINGYVQGIADAIADKDQQKTA